ncbi:Y-family DNA polymerase [Acinetobacter ursingii]|uniref:Y-family DNA polymerase n=1 Tax=Acinetobacter ursingii TaxID=108980 RepID=UPI0032B355D3
MMNFQRQYYALIDINNCYVSCERLFQPKFSTQPVVVLSNNDGCVVSRSNEAKALGIKMAVPWHQIKDLPQYQGVQVFSSNYTLYAEMSRRFFLTIQEFFHAEDTEAYSIDECFIHLTAYVDLFDIKDYCQQLVKKLEQCLGLPCSIGIGHSKTQAKLANHFAKKISSFKGVCFLEQLDPLILEDLMINTPAKEVWGIGHQISKRLQAYNIYSCYDLTFANEHYLAKEFSVIIARTICELKGQSCISLDDPKIPSKRILASRSFSKALNDLNQIKQALIFHLNRAHRRLMSQQQLCHCIQVFLYEKIEAKPYKKAHVHAVGLEYATDDLLILTKFSLQQLDVLFDKNKKYIKIGIMFCGLYPRQQHIDDLWQPLEQIHERQKLMLALSSIKNRFGNESLQVGYHSCQSQWKMKQLYCSPHYLTRWNELLCIDDSHMAVTQNK